MSTEINPFDLLSGKVVQNKWGTFWFKDAGNHIDSHGLLIYDNLLKAITNTGYTVYAADNDDKLICDRGGKISRLLLDLHMAIWKQDKEVSKLSEYKPV